MKLLKNFLIQKSLIFNIFIIVFRLYKYFYFIKQIQKTKDNK